MDPYSLSVECEASKNIEENERECFKDAIVSSRSLNKGFVEPTNLKNAFREIAACIIAASFHIALGLNMAYSAILIPHLEAEDSELPATKEETSWITSVVVLCTLIAAIIGGFMMESFGRLRTLQIGAIPCVAGWTLIATATNIPMLLVGRLLSGFSCALASSPAIVYITEVARPDLRGSMISFGPTLASFGMLLVYVKGAFMHWRLVAWLGIIYAVVPIVLIQLFVPESPIWLVSKGRIDEARKSLEWLYKSQEKQGTISVAEAHFNMIMKENEIKLSEQRRSKRGSAFNKLRSFLKPTGWKPMMILFLFFAFQQFSGIYITLFYAVSWFQDMNAGVDAYIASILVGATRFFCSMVNTWLLRRYKRRPLCIVSGVGMAICMIVSGYFTLRIYNGDRSGYWVPVFCLLLYVCTSMVGMLTIPWTMTAELFPTNIRGIAHSISYSMANLLMFAALQSYRRLQAFLGGSYACQWFFAGISLGAAFFVWVMLPETHGKKLSEIEEYFENNFVACIAGKNAKKRRNAKSAEQLNKPTVIEPLNPKIQQKV